MSSIKKFGTKLIIDGMMYIRSRPEQGGKSYWDCTRVRTKKCKARAITIQKGNEIILLKGGKKSDHQHPINTSEKDGNIVMEELKRVPEDHLETSVWNHFKMGDEKQHDNNSVVNQSNMFDEKKDLLNCIAKASKMIRHKHRMLKVGKETAEQNAQEFFKPLINPIEKIVAQEKEQLRVKEEKLIKKENDLNNMLQNTFIKNEESNDSFKSIINDENSQRSLDVEMSNSSYIEPIIKEEIVREEENTSRQISELIQEYLRKADNKNNTFDLVTGVRKLQKGRYLGNQLIEFENNYILISGEKYPATKGLLELIFKKVPNDDYISSTDKELYKKILMQTSAHKKGYLYDEELRNDKKTKNLIQTMFIGQGLPRYMLEQKRKIDYVHWDDPNKLVDRLRYLMGSQATDHSNEIMSIIEELREANIIY